MLDRQRVGLGSRRMYNSRVRGGAASNAEGVFRVGGRGEAYRSTERRNRRGRDEVWDAALIVIVIVIVGMLMRPEMVGSGSWQVVMMKKGGCGCGVQRVGWRVEPACPRQNV